MHFTSILIVLGALNEVINAAAIKVAAPPHSIHYAAFPTATSTIKARDSEPLNALDVLNEALETFRPSGRVRKPFGGVSIGFPAVTPAPVPAPKPTTSKQKYWTTLPCKDMGLDDPYYGKVCTLY